MRDERDETFWQKQIFFSRDERERDMMGAGGTVDHKKHCIERNRTSIIVHYNT